MSRIFLSHSDAQREVADAIRERLTQQGIQVWSDEQLSPGDNLADRIGEELRSADAFVLVLGAESARSQWQMLEVGGALASGKLVIPVVTARDVPVPHMLRNRQYLVAQDANAGEEIADRVVAVLRDPAGEPSRSDTSPGLSLLNDAQASLAMEQEAYEKASLLERRLISRRLAVLALLSISVTFGVLALVAVGDSAVLSGLVAGFGAVLGAVVGYSVSSSRRSAP